MFDLASADSDQPGKPPALHPTTSQHDFNNVLPYGRDLSGLLLRIIYQLWLTKRVFNFHHHLNPGHLPRFKL